MGTVIKSIPKYEKTSDTHGIEPQSLDNLWYVEEQYIRGVGVEYPQSILRCDWMRGILSREVGEGNDRRY